MTEEENMKVSVKGVGMTKFGELWDQSLIDLAIEAGEQAIKDSGLSKNQIEAVFMGNMLSGNLSGQNHLGALVASKLGLKNVAAFSNEAACASGGIATHLAVSSLIAEAYENVLVVGVEKMTDVSGDEISTALTGAGSEEEKIAGLTFPGLYALMARAHMEKYGTTREQLATVSSKNHYHGSLNKKAQYPFEVSVEKVLKSPMIADPLTLFDASPITDGAAAIVLSSKIKKGDVLIRASTVSTDSLGLADRKSLTEIKATMIASQKAFKQSGFSIGDIDVAEVHDCFTIAEILAMEDIGFCPKGSGGKFMESGETRLGGKMPVNTSGGLKSCGHPVGATGVKQIIEITEQLRGSLGRRQVKNAKVGLTQNVGGTGATVAIHILQKG